jgi:hypothetical protein
MKARLPEIVLPAEPLPDAWQDAVAALVERAQVIEAWALESRERSLFALRRYEDVTLMLDELLDDPRRHQEAHAAIRVAAEGIKAQRAEQGQTAH